jgi:hypothetical protein
MGAGNRLFSSLSKMVRQILGQPQNVIIFDGMLYLIPVYIVSGSAILKRNSIQFVKVIRV